MQHLVNTLTAFAAKFFVAVDGFKFKTRYFNRQAAKIAIFFDFIRHDTNPFSFGKFQQSIMELYPIRHNRLAENKRREFPSDLSNIAFLKGKY